MARKILALVVAIMLISYLAIAGVVYRIGSTPPKYNDIEISITDVDDQAFVTKADVMQQLRHAKINPVGQPFDSVNTLAISKVLERNKLIKKAHCYHSPDSVLHIDIDQRHPILRVKSISQGDFYVDREGFIMPVQNIVPMQIPLATGNISKEKASNDLYVLAQYLNDNKFWRQNITQIYVKTNGDIELIPRVGTHTILLGTAENCEKKLNNVRKFYDKVLSRKGWNFYKVINVKYNDQVVGEKPNK